jgi:hypothetical protein
MVRKKKFNESNTLPNSEEGFIEVFIWPSNLLALLFQFYVVNWNSVTEAAFGVLLKD